MYTTYRVRKEYKGPERDKDQNIGEFKTRAEAEMARVRLSHAEKSNEYDFRVVTAIYFKNVAGGPSYPLRDPSSR
jgi:hypothetical protein